MTSSPSSSAIELVSLPRERIESCIYLIRGEKVVLDADLAALYGVDTKALNQAVKRNAERFPADFMFELTQAETDAILRSQIVTANARNEVKAQNISDILRSQNVTSKRRTNPYAFTEQGIAMLSGVLRSPRAIAVNVEIMRSFVRLRQMIAGHADLAKKLRNLEKKYDEQFKMVFDAIRELMEPITDEDRAREIGFHTTLKTPAPKKP